MRECKKGMVIEAIAEGRITVISPQGEFLDLDWPKTALPEVGSEVEFTVPVLRKKNFIQKHLLAIAACFLMLIIGASVWSGLLIPQPGKVVAYISIDINPSIELGINKNDKIIEVTGLNDDGSNLLAKLDLLRLSPQKAMQLITAEAVNAGYLAAGKDNAVLITVSGKDQDKVPDKVRNLDQQVKRILTDNKIVAETNILEVPSEIRERAKELDVSPGKYVILMEAVDQGLDLTLEEIKGSSIVKAIKDSGGIPGQVISGAHNNQETIKEVQNRYEHKIKEREKTRETFSQQTGKDEVKKPVDSANSPKDNGSGPGYGKETVKNVIENRGKDAEKNADKSTDINEKKKTEADSDKNIGKGAENTAVERMGNSAMQVIREVLNKITETGQKMTEKVMGNKQDAKSNSKNRSMGK